MSDNKNEPSVSEILSAIRNNMQPSDEDAVVRQRKSGLSENDVFDLTEELQDDSDVKDFPMNTKAADILRQNVSKTSNIRDDRVISEDCSKKMIDSLDQLPGISTGSRDKAAYSGELDLACSLDKLIRQSLRDWMEINLPGIVERIVEKEVSYLTEKYKK